MGLSVEERIVDISKRPQIWQLLLRHWMDRLAASERAFGHSGMVFVRSVALCYICWRSFRPVINEYINKEVEEVHRNSGTWGWGSIAKTVAGAVNPEYQAYLDAGGDGPNDCGSDNFQYGDQSGKCEAEGICDKSRIKLGLGDDKKGACCRDSRNVEGAPPEPPAGGPKAPPQTRYHTCVEAVPTAAEEATAKTEAESKRQAKAEADAKAEEERQRQAKADARAAACDVDVNSKACAVDRVLGDELKLPDYDYMGLAAFDGNTDQTLKDWDCHVKCGEVSGLCQQCQSNGRSGVCCREAHTDGCGDNCEKDTSVCAGHGRDTGYHTCAEYCPSGGCESPEPR